MDFVIAHVTCLLLLLVHVLNLTMQVLALLFIGNSGCSRGRTVGAANKGPVHR